MKLKLILFIIIILKVLSFKAQDTIYVFKTYENYKNNIGEKMDEYVGTMHVMGKFSMLFSKEKKGMKFKCKDFWGFNYNGHLFRNDFITQQPCCVIKQSKCVFYADGQAYLRMIRDKTDHTTFSMGYYYYISNTLESEICPLVVTNESSPKPLFTDSKKKFKKFKLANPHHLKFYECLQDNTDIKIIENCIKDY